jgi:ABC-type multidrug transport system ATPase subunit
MLIDGKDLYHQLDAYRTQMGYVPQDDIIHKDLPVRRALWYAAKLRVPDATAKEVNERIDRVLDLVDMRAHDKKPVKVLSGGQRKRVSIAAELLAEPALLFLDEPTSGLDPGLEKKMMYDLNVLADEGKTVVLVTHATANIEQCHHVAFLVRGRLAYYGPPAQAIEFFDAHDFADIYLKLSQEVNPEAGQPVPAEVAAYYPEVAAELGTGVMPAGMLWAAHYRQSAIYQKYVSARQRGNGRTPSGTRQAGKARQPSASRRRSPGRAVGRWLRRQFSKHSPLRQLWLLARRQFELIRYDWITLFVLLLMMPFIAALFMGVSNEEDLVGRQMTRGLIEIELKKELRDAEEGESADYMPSPTAEMLITMLGLALTQAGTFGAAFEIVKERPIFARERAVNLGVGAYVGAKVLVLGVFAVLQVASSLFVLSLRLDLGFEPILENVFESGAWELGVTLFFAVLASIMMGLFISAVVPNQNVVLYVILGQLFVQIILSGALFPLPDSDVTDIVSKSVVSHWTMEAMGSTVDVRKLNDESVVCTVIPELDPRATEDTRIECDSAALSDEDLKLDYEHSEEHLWEARLALLIQAAVWGILTVVVQVRKKPR